METKYFIDDLEKYKEWRESRAWVFTDTIRDHEEQVVSPCKKYVLDIYKYPTHEGKSNYKEGVVTRLSDNKEIVSIKRNYSSFPFKFINDYLICGEDYQGYTIVDLDKEEQSIYFPDAGFKGHGFCWASIYGVTNNKLVVEGCYWGAPYEVVLYDFTNPLVLPLPELERLDVDIEGEVKLNGNILTVEQELEYRLSDGVLCSELSEDEQKILNDNFPKLSAFKIVVITRTL